MVHHTSTPLGPYVQHLNRCHRRYTNCSVILDILHGHGNQRRRQRYSHRDHRRQRHRSVGCNLHTKHPFLDQGFGHDHGHTDLKRWNGHVVVDLCNTPCGSLLRHLHGCHQRYTNGRHFCSDLHRHRQQHRRQCHDHGDHPRQRCRSSDRLQPEFTHLDQRLGHVNADPIVQRWSSHLVVDFTIATKRPHVQHLNRCDQRNAHRRVFIEQLHRHGHQPRWHRHGHGHHPGQRCVAVLHRLHRKSVHPHQGHGHNHGHPKRWWWNGCLLVDFPNAPCRSPVFQLHRCHFRNTNGCLIPDTVHGDGEQLRW